MDNLPSSRACLVSSDIYRATGYGPQHPLGIARIGTVLDICQAMGWLDNDAIVASPRATVGQLQEFHNADYIEALIAAEAAGKISTIERKKYNLGTMENPVFQGVFERASTSVGGSIRAAQLALDGQLAYHPAGGTHHGQPGRASGFCYFNDPVFAILSFLEHGLERVLYADFDAHHGDGVEDAFADDHRVFTLSVHEENRWPYTGKLGDRRSGNARNMPVPTGFNDSEFAYLMDQAVLPIAGRFAPQALVITCGADGLAGDPLSKLELSNVALWDGVLKLVAMQVPTVVVGGGGYNPWTVSRCWAGLWARLSGQEIPATAPQPVCDILSRLECDLVDEEDVKESWLNSICDAPNEGTVRRQIREIARASLADE